MPSPFYLAVKGTTSGTPGTGAFTPNAASSGFRAWSTVPVGVYLVRYDDGTAWELTYSYWNGTALSRASTQVYDSSTGSQLTLTSAATASMVVDPADLQPHLAAGIRGWNGVIGAAQAPSPIGGIGVLTTTGTAGNTAIVASSLLSEQPRSLTASATTANAQAGFSYSTAMAAVSSAAGRGGYEFVCRFATFTPSSPTGPRLFVGMTATTMVGVTTEPSAQTFNMAGFGKDSTDTNIQLIVNSGVGGATKTDTGIAYSVNELYEVTIWQEPGSLQVNALLIGLNNGSVGFGKTSTDVPVTGSLMFPQCIGGLSSTTGTAFNMNLLQMTVRGAL